MVGMRRRAANSRICASSVEATYAAWTIRTSGRSRMSSEKAFSASSRVRAETGTTATPSFAATLCMPLRASTERIVEIVGAPDLERVKLDS
jgi:hypothetical protein